MTRPDIETLCRAFCRLDGVDPDRRCDGSFAWEAYALEAGRAHQALGLIEGQADLFGVPA